MQVIVPFDATDPKTRLSPVLDPAERRAFAGAMCRDVLDAVRTAGGDPRVLSTAPVEFGVPTTVDERPLTAAVNAVLSNCEGSAAVVMADLGLAIPDALERVFTTDGEIVLVPGRGGGTNIIVVRQPEFRVDYHDGSIRDHRERASQLGVSPASVDSFRLSTDVDDPADLVEVLLHTDGRAAAWLRDAGFEVSNTDGRLSITRSGEE